jgi:hypothetical protein
MALTPADFAAYSRATGAPYPEDPEEKAALAPEVLQFRQNQLRAPQQESNPLAVLGTAALGLGALAGGVALARRFGLGAAKATASTQPSLTQKGIQDVSAIGRQRAAEQTVRQARQERPAGIVQTDLSTVDKLLADLELKQLVQKQTAQEEAELRSEMARQQARVQAQKREDLWNLVKEIQSETPVVNQTIGALESGEDQMTARVMRGVLRNEDLDASQVNEVARQTGSIEVAASLTPDGIPVDQTVVLPKKENIIISERLYTQPSKSIQAIAARTKTRQTPSEVTLIGRYPSISEEVPSMPRGLFPGSLGESLGEAVTFTPVDPYQGRTNITRGGVEFTVQEGRLEGVPARTTVLPRGTATEGLRGPAVPAAETFSPEEAAAKLEEFQLSREMQLQNAMAKGLSEARARRNVQLSENQKAALESTLPNYSPEDVMSQPGLAAYGDVSEAERFSEEMASKSGRLKSLEEGGFLEEQLDPGQLRTEPRQVYPGVMIRPASRTSYRGMTGRPGVGIYGEQAPGRPGEPGFGAGAIEAKKEIKVEGEERGVTTPRAFIPGADLPEYRTPEGFVYTEEAMTQPTKATGGYKRYGTQPPSRPETRLDSLEVSQELTRLQREGRTGEAQAFLDKIMQERGISNVGISQPLRPQINRQGRF